MKSFDKQLKQTLNKISHTLIISSSICLYSACSTIPNTADSVKQLADSKHFEQAISIYQKLTPEQQQLIDLNDINKDKIRYENQLISNVNKQQRKLAFDEAESLLKEGEANIPSSAALQQAKTQLSQAKKAYTDKYQHSYDVEYAQFLIQEESLLKKLSITEKHKKDFNQHANHQAQERIRIGETLGTEGLKALENKQYTDANQLLTLAQSLHPDTRWDKGIASIHKKDNRQKNRNAKIARQRQQKAEKQRILAQQKTQQEIESLKQSFDLATINEDILQASHDLNRLIKLDNKNNHEVWIQTSKKKLDTLKEKKLQETLAKGKILYSKGKINAAINTWKQALAFAPENLQLNEHILRAETFQARFKELAQ